MGGERETAVDDTIWEIWNYLEDETITFGDQTLPIPVMEVDDEYYDGSTGVGTRIIETDH